ncbi:MAG: BadF/BadG/BcrA/BcrD ATPase family protein [Anaerolineae bacterium]
MTYFLGVDVGGTKTHALVADEHGHARGLGHAGPGNHEMVGWEGLEAVLGAATAEALARTGISRDQIAGAGFGVAGYDWASERERTLAAIRTLGLTAPVEAVNDGVLGLIAGASEGWGVALSAGTGCNCYGRDRQGRIGRMTGEGDTMGEAAGAGTVVAEAIRHISRAWSRRGPATALTPAFLALAGATEVEQFLEGVCEGQYSYDAEAAPIVFQVAAQGDAVARTIIEWAGRELGNLAVGVIRQLELEADDFEIVLAGSLFEGGPLLTEPLQVTVHAVAPRARFVRLTAPPVVGGVLLGMEAAGRCNPALRVSLIASLL